MKYSIKDESSGTDLGFLVLTKAQRQACRQRFQSYQKIGSLKLHKEQIRQLLIQLNKNPTEEQLMRMIFEGDPSGKEEIEYAAFEKIITECKETLQSKDDSEISKVWFYAENVFDLLEKDNKNTESCTVSVSSIEKMLRENFKIDISLEMFVEYVGGKSQISYEEFKTLLEF